MKNQNQNAGDELLSGEGLHQPPPLANGSVLGSDSSDVEALSAQPRSLFGEQPQPVSIAHVNAFRRILKPVGITVAGIAGVGLIAMILINVSSQDRQANNVNNVARKYANQEIPLAGLAVQAPENALAAARNVSINAPLTLNEGLIITPSVQPNSPSKGQLYMDQNTSQLAYFNGAAFVPLATANTVVQSIGGATGPITLGGGLSVVGNQLTVTVDAPGVGPSVTSFGGANGDITLGAGLAMTGSTLRNAGALNILAGSNIGVSNDGNGNFTITNTGSGTGTVASSGGTVGNIPVFTGSQNIEDSIISQLGSTITVSGNVSVSGGTLNLATPLAVSSGGTGAGSLAANGVVVGNGTSALTAVTAGAPGQCLLSTAGAPTFGVCPGAGVASLNSLTGALTIADASAAGTTITINDATTGAKGIASFNSTNFSVTTGAVNTAQNINTGATPTFAGVNTNNITPSAALTVGVSAQTALLQGSTTTITSNGGSNNIILNSAGTIELLDNTNVTGNLGVSGDLAVNGGDLTASGGLNITTGGATSLTPGGALTVGAAGQALTLQGNATTTFRSTDSGNTTIVAFANPVADTTLNFPALSAGNYTICTDAGNCASAGVTLQTAYNNSTQPEIVLDATRGALTIRDNLTPIAANLLEVQNNGGGTTYLGVTSSGTTITGTATVSGNINTTGGVIQTAGTTRIDGSGNLSNIASLTLSGAISGGTTYSGSGNINTSAGTLQTAGTTRIDNSGNLANIGTLTLSGAISGGTSFTGSGNINTTGGVIQTAGTTRIDNSGNLTNIGSLTASGNGTFQGGTLTLGTTTQAGSLALHDGAGNTGSLQVLVLGQDTVYQLPDPSAPTAVICLDTGNCAGSGGGVTTAGGTTNRVSKFTGSQTLGDSSISDNGTVVTVNGTANLVVQGGTATLGTLSQTGTLAISDGSSNTVSIVATGLAANRTYTLPDAGGPATFCLDTGNCIGGGGGGAPNDATYLVATLNGTLTNERALASGTNISLTDGGAGANMTVATVNNPTFSTSVTTPILQSSGALSITSAAGETIAINAGTTIELQDSTNVNGSLDVSADLNVGTSNAFQVNSSGAIAAAAGITSSGTIIFSGLNCTVFANGGTLTTNGSGQLTCADDDGGAGGAISGAGTAGTLPVYTGAQTIADSIITQSGTTIDIAGDLTLDDALTVDNGGTGATSFTARGVLYGNGAGVIQVTGAPTSGQVMVADGSGLPNFVSFSGDVIVSSTGGTTIQANAVALGTDTTGDYVANLGTLTGLTTGGNSGEGSTPTLSVTYGSIANTAVQGNVTLTCPSGTGNLTGGGTSVTLGAGGSCGAINTVNNPTFSTSVTTASLILTGAGSTGTIQVGNLGQGTVYTLPDPGGAAATICISTGNCAAAGSAGGDLTGTYPNPTIASLQGTNLNITAPTAGHVLIYNDTDDEWQNRAISSDLAISETGVATIQSNAVALGTDTTGNYVIGLTAGNGIDITGSAGEGWSPTVAVLYGSSANTAVQGNTSLTVTAGTNITGGGTITLGSGGSVTVNVANSPTFSGTLTVQGATATVGTAALAGSVVLNDGSSNTGTIQTAALGQNTTFTLPDPGGAAATICISTGNCAGAGGGVTTSGGTTDRVSKFTGAQTIGDSTISDNGSVVTINGTANLVVQGGTGTLGTTTTAGTLAISDGSSNTVSIVAAGLAADRIYTLPDAGGPATFCLTSGNCVGSGGGSAPHDASYLVLSLNGSLSSERALASGTNIAFTDGGVNGNLTVATVNNPTFSTSVTTPALQSSGALTISSAGGQTVAIDASTTIELQDSTNVTGSLDVSVALNVGTSNAFQVNSSGAIVAAAGITSSGTITFSGLDCTTFANGGAVTTNGSGVLSCSDDNGAPANTITGTGTSGTVPVFSGAQVIGDSIITQSGTTIDIAGDLTLDTDLTVANGGTGASSFTSRGVLYGNGTGAIQVTGAPSAGQVLVADGSGVPTFVSFSGDVSVSDTGLTTIQANSVALGTDTTGNYVSVLGSLTGLSTTGNTGEGSTPTLSVIYGSGANNAVQGNTTLTCPSGTGNLTGGGTSITLGTGGSCANLNTVNNPTFSTSVTTPSLVLTGAGSNGTIGVANLGQPTAYTLPDPGVGTATICLSSGNCAAAGSAGGDLTGNYPNPTIASLQGTDLNISSPTAGHVLIYNDTNDQWENHAVSSDLAIGETGVATIQANAVALGTDTTGNYVATLGSLTGLSTSGNTGEGSTPTLSVIYGSSANNAVQGNTSITVSPGTNLTGGGSITLGSGGTVTLNVSNNPTFSGNVTVQGGTTTVGTAGVAGVLELSDGSSHTGVLQTAALGQNSTYTLPDPGVGGTASICLTTGNCLGAGGGSAPHDAQYLVLSLNGSLTNERALTNGSNISFTDGGAGGNLTVATVMNPSFTTSVTTPSLQSSAALALGSAAANNINVSPGTTGDVVFTHGNSSNLQIAGTQTADNTLNLVDITLTNNSSASTGTLYGLSVNNADNGGNTGVADAIARFINNQATETLTDGVLIQNNPNSGVLTNALRILQSTTGGTTTNGITIERTNGTLTNGIAFTGTIGTDINRASGTLTLRGASGVTVDTGASGVATAFQVQDAGAASLLTVDTTARSGSGGNLIKIGNSTGTDTATTLFQLDAATANPSSNLAALNGSLFYNSTSHKVSVIENGAVKALCNAVDLGCGTGGGGSLDAAYDASSTPATISMDVDNKSVVWNMGETGSNDPNFIVNMQCTNCTTTGKFAVQDAGVDLLAVLPQGFVTVGTVAAPVARLDVAGTPGIVGSDGGQALRAVGGVGGDGVCGSCTGHPGGHGLTATGGAGGNGGGDADGGEGGGVVLQGGAGGDGGGDSSTTGGLGGSISLTGGTGGDGISGPGAGGNIILTAGLNGDSTARGNISLTGRLTASSTASATAFQIQDASAAAMFVVDSTARSGSGGNLIKIGNSTGTDTALTILKLDAATADPTSNLAALNGGLFYNSTTNKVSIVENGAVKALCNAVDLGCGSGGAGTLQAAYDADTNGSDVTVAVSSTDGSIIFQNPSSSGTSSGYVFRVDQLNTGAVDGMRITTSGTGNALGITASASGIGASSGKGIVVTTANGNGGGIAGGSGGDGITVTAGSGAAGLSGGAGGNGGSGLLVTSGSGAAGQGNGNGGNGGVVTLTAGAGGIGGANTGTTGGAGGDVTITAGDGGNRGSGTSNYGAIGDIFLQAGAHGSGSGLGGFVQVGSATTNDDLNLFILDAYNSTDPSNVSNGAIYYSTGGQGGAGTTNEGKMRCYEAGVWKNCIGMRDIVERRWGYLVPAGTSATAFSAFGNAYVPGVTNTATASSQTESFYLNYATGTTSGNNNGLDTGTFTTASTQGRWRPKIATRIRTDASTVANVRYWVSMASATLTGTDPATATTASSINHIGLGASSAFSGGNWICSAGDGTNRSGTSTGVAIAANTYYDIIVDMSQSGEVVCSVAANGGAFTTVTHTNNLPSSSTTQLGLHIAVTTLTTAARNLGVSYAFQETN